MLASSFLLVSVALIAGIESWADPAMPVKRGLILWLDAQKLPEAMAKTGRGTSLVLGQRVDAWLDASGSGMHFAQRRQESQPRLGPGGVHFDGKDDVLELLGAKRSIEACTLFMIVSPRSNTGGFRCFFAANELGKNDYLTGINVDLGSGPSKRLEVINVEGPGFSGMRNLLLTPMDFGVPRVLTITCDDDLQLRVDGQAQGKRPRTKSALRFDQLSLGARSYSNSGDPPYLSGHLDGDMHDVLLFDRVLSAAERDLVERYLLGRRAAIGVGDQSAGHLLQPVADPPPVRMLLPGFSVRELPVKLTNINNVRYRPDGKLVASAYNGNIYLLSDTDGDGLEDKVDLFWDNKGRIQSPIGIALTPTGYPHGDGVFVACKGKVSLIVDTDGDGKADKEIIVAKGWKPLPHNVDALGVALDGDGNLYFGLGTEDYTNGHLVDGNGVGRYKLDSERGTIMKVSADFKHREVLCTGIRFPVGMAFNRTGDLFVTDQEGATWLPNGNPFDELLHIQPGRHYGFPPRHPKHLPKVIDEPSVYDFGPQHQSTCGLMFVERFGPSAWTGDALICGESRGKLYRTRLAKAKAGYVASSQVLACLRMLTVDACESPKGHLVVAAHGGQPDWGTGPNGEGKLYQIAYTDQKAPIPVACWSAGPREVRIAFDRPIPHELLQAMARDVVVERGAYVREGDRFETLRPGYAVVSQQMSTPRYDLPVRSIAASPDRRMLMLGTAEQPEATHYAITLQLASKVNPNAPAMDLGFDLSGAAAAWVSQDGKASWEGWLPHLDSAVNDAFTAGSAFHEELRQRLGQPGRLTLKTQLDLDHMLRPRVQPGSRLDYTPTLEQVTLYFHSEALVDLKTTEQIERKGSTWRLLVSGKERAWVPIEVTLETGSKWKPLDVAFSTAEDSRQRALALHRLLLPWARRPGMPRPPARAIAALAGGSWLRGREVFHGDQAACWKCHRFQGQGGLIGPDLSNLSHRDYSSVLRDIRDPNAAIHPDHFAQVVTLRDGRMLVGSVRAGSNGTLIIGDAAGKQLQIALSEIEEMQPASTSIMPTGLDAVLGPDKLRDLMTFLLAEQIKPAPLERPGEPPARTLSEVQAVGAVPEASNRRLRVLLAAGAKDHGPGEHDYPLWQRRWLQILSMADGLSVETAQDWPTPAQWKWADVVVLFSANPAWSDAKAPELDSYLARGGGLLLLHWAVNGQKHPAALAERIGLAWQNGRSRFRHGKVDLTLHTNPITRGLSKLTLEDESYWNLMGDPKRITVLAEGAEEGKMWPLIWTREQGKGRVFVSILGHYNWTFDDPLFRILLLRGLCWTAREPLDRLSALATVGARIREE